MSYRMFLYLDTKTIEFPVLPETIKIESEGNNETVDVIGIGEVNRINKKKLRSVTIESIFPMNDAPYVTSISPLEEPNKYVEAIQIHREREKVGRFSVHGSTVSFTMLVSIEDFSYEERAGEVGDIYYSLKLKEWKDYSAKRMVINSSTKKATATQATRPVTKQQSKTHTVVSGESLWSICKKEYGDGSKYPQLYTKNKALIDKRNKGNGVPKYTIYSGQVLLL